jgi:hypothetical protein
MHEATTVSNLKEHELILPEFQSKLLIPDEYEYGLAWIAIPIEFIKYSTANESNNPLDIAEMIVSNSQENTLADYDKKIQDIIYYFRQSTFLNRDEIANKLLNLFLIISEENPRESEISINSLQNFFNFFNKYNHSETPLISLSQNDIYATWKNNGERLSLHFLPENQINFVLFLENDEDPSNKIRSYGNTTLEMFESSIAINKVKQWIK